MNIKLVAVQEAFQAMLAGKNILVRSTDSTLLKDFRPVSEFAADIWAKVGFEFTIQIDMLELAGISFTKPYALDELVDGQEIFMVSNTGSVVRAQFIQDYPELLDVVANGFVQRDLENAKLQLTAIQKSLGVTREIIYKEMDFREFSKSSQKRKKSNSTVATKKDDQNSASNDVEKKTSAKSAFTIDDVQEIEVDSETIIQNFTDRINAATTEEEALNLRYVFSANGHLDTEQVQALCRLVEQKCEALNPEKYVADPVKVSHSTKSLYMEALTGASTIKEIKDIEADIKTEKRLTDIHRSHLETYIDMRSVLIKRDDLIERALHAATPVEANALVKYTTDWSEEQCKPLLDAINKRLVELDAQNKTNPQSPPSLMVQIETAPDLTTLDALEIDVSTRHPDIQPKLMGYIRKRRAELEN